MYVIVDTVIVDTVVICCYCLMRRPSHIHSFFSRQKKAIVGDQDGVVVVPAKVAETVYSIAHGREVIEDIVKEELTKNPGPPGKFYPFMSGKIKHDSPLAKLLATHGITPENSNQFEGTADW